MAKFNDEVNVNKIIGNSTEIATEVRIRDEILESTNASLRDRWRQMRPLVLKYRDAQTEIGQKFSFALYTAEMITLLGQILDQGIGADTSKAK